MILTNTHMCICIYEYMCKHIYVCEYMYVYEVYTFGLSGSH